MKILLTGRTGFIGSHLYPKLIDEGHEVWNLTRHVAGRYEYLKSEKERFVFADLTDFSRVREIVQQVQPEVVIHLAAKTPVSLSFNEPMDFWEVTATGTVNLAEACKELENLQKFIHASTSEVYGIQDEFPIKETAPYNPESPYAVGKVAAEEYLKMLRKVYNFPFIIIRPFNSYGRQKIKHYVVERAITTLLEHGEVRLWNPHSIRDFLFVDDHANGYVSVLEKGKVGETYNFCTGRGTSIKELAELIVGLLGYGSLNFSMPRDRPFEIPKLVGDNSKARNELGWEPKWSLENGLRETIDLWRKERLGNRRS